jgi:serine kinase of HPr protein (carbohydrate metabolism regulator)
VLLLGPREIGKSLLAAALARRGHCVLSDEVAAVAAARSFPAGSMLSLADDALVAAGIAPEALPQYTNFPIAKRLWIAGPRPQPRPYEIAAVLRLKKAEAEAPIEPARLDSDAALEALLDQFYRRDMLKILETGIGARREAAVLIEAAPVYRFPVPRTLDRVEEVADHMEDLVR